MRMNGVGRIGGCLGNSHGRRLAQKRTESSEMPFLIASLKIKTTITKQQ